MSDQKPKPAVRIAVGVLGVVISVALIRYMLLNPSLLLKPKSDDEIIRNVRRARAIGTPADLKPLATNYGDCIVSRMITRNDARIGFMYREEPQYIGDSGWYFTAGVESQEYLDNPANYEICDVNQIANVDPQIVLLLDTPIGAAFERSPESGEFLWVEPEE